MNNSSLQWVSSVKYLGIVFKSNSGLTDITNHVRKFYSHFNNILSVIGKCSRKMCTLYLSEVYCLPALS